MVGVIVGATLCTNGGGVGINVIVAAGVDTDVVTKVIVVGDVIVGTCHCSRKRLI